MPLIDDTTILAANSTTRRATKDRLAEEINVKNFGATGDGTTDDTASIQAAIDWQILTGNRGTIFFPPGTYKLTAPLTFDVEADHSIVLRGTSRGASKLTGNFAGYLIDRFLAVSAGDGQCCIEDLSVINSSTDVASGCIRWHASIGLYLKGLNLCGYRGFTSYEGLFMLTVINCRFPGTGQATIPDGSWGIMVHLGNPCAIIGCDFTGWDHAIRMASNASVIGSRFEMNNVGLAIGYDELGGSQEAGGLIGSCSFEANRISVDIFGAQALQLTACGFTAEHFTTDGGRSTESLTWAGGTATLTDTAHGLTGSRGIWVQGATPSGYNGYHMVTIASANTLTFSLSDPSGSPASVPGDYSPVSTHAIKTRGPNQALITGITCNGPFSTAAIDWYDAAATNTVFAGCLILNAFPGQPVINYPASGRAGMTFIRCTGATNAMLFADLPASPVEGMEFDITNANTETWGATVSTTGAYHVKVRYNGTNWTVVGK